MAAILSITIGIILLIIGVLFTERSLDNDKFSLFIVGLVCCFSSIFVAAFVYSSLTCNTPSNDTPQAIDVYRGKTALEITYRDSIPVDSVVVFKE